MRFATLNGFHIGLSEQEMKRVDLTLMNPLWALLQSCLLVVWVLVFLGGTSSFLLSMCKNHTHTQAFWFLRHGVEAVVKNLIFPDPHYRLFLRSHCSRHSITSPFEVEVRGVRAWCPSVVFKRIITHSTTRLVLLTDNVTNYLTRASRSNTSGTLSERIHKCVFRLESRVVSRMVVRLMVFD